MAYIWKHSSDINIYQHWQTFITFYTNKVKKKTRGYSLTLTFCRTTRGSLITKRPSIFYKLPTLPPYLVHHSFSQVRSRVHTLLRETKVYAFFRANQWPEESCIISAGASTHCSNTRYKVQFRVEWQCKHSFSCPSEKKAEVYLVPTSSSHFFSSVAQWVLSVFTGSLMCLNCDTPIQCTQSTSFIRQPQINFRRHQFDSNCWVIKLELKTVISSSADAFANSFHEI